MVWPKVITLSVSTDNANKWLICKKVFLSNCFNTNKDNNELQTHKRRDLGQCRQVNFSIVHVLLNEA